MSHAAFPEWGPVLPPHVAALVKDARRKVNGARAEVALALALLDTLLENLDTASQTDPSASQEPHG